uniref:Uncharacterized protein n=1 Tax=Rhizophora mucronata TaxID=61149 RepID=A0A2P2PPL9_RHIMU
MRKVGDFASAFNFATACFSKVLWKPTSWFWVPLHCRNKDWAVLEGRQPKGCSPVTTTLFTPRSRMRFKFRAS